MGFSVSFRGVLHHGVTRVAVPLLAFRCCLFVARMIFIAKQQPDQWEVFGFSAALPGEFVLHVSNAYRSVWKVHVLSMDLLWKRGKAEGRLSERSRKGGTRW
jgi:hypothetical protein